MAVGERDVVVDVTIKSDTRGAKQAAAALGDVGKAADRTGHSFHSMSDDMKAVDLEIQKTTANIERLEREMLHTGDRSLQRSIASERRWLASVRKVTSVDFTRENPFTEFGNTIKGLPRLLSGSGIIGGLTALAALGPLLGGGVAGLVSGAVGTGGIAGGIAMAANEPKVQAAAKAFGSSIAQEFFSGGGVFVQPVIDSLTILEDAFKDMDLGGVFAQMAPVVTTIAAAFGAFAKNIMPGLDKAFSRMDVFADVFAEGFAETGVAVGHFLDLITESEGAVMGLEAAFKILNVSIVAVGQTLNYLSDAFAGSLFIGEKITGFLEDVPLIGPSYDKMNDLINDTAHAAGDAGHAVGGLRPHAESARYGFHVLAEAIAETRDNLLILADQITGMINEQVALDKAQLAAQQGWLDIADAINVNGTALGTGTEKAIALEEAFLRQIDVLAAVRDGTIKVTGKVDEANAVYDDQIQKLIDIGVKAGLSREKLEELAGDYFVKVIFMAQLSADLARLSHLLPGYGSNVTSFASGGTTPSGEVFRVGEAGPEYLFSSKQHFVANQQMMSGASGGGTANATRVVVDVTGGDEDLKRLIRKWVRIDGPQVIGIS